MSFFGVPLNPIEGVAVFLSCVLGVLMVVFAVTDRPREVLVAFVAMAVVILVTIYFT